MQSRTIQDLCQRYKGKSALMDFFMRNMEIRTSQDGISIKKNVYVYDAVCINRVSFQPAKSCLYHMYLFENVPGIQFRPDCEALIQETVLTCITPWSSLVNR